MRDYLITYSGDSASTELLVKMTNLYIDYRNQVWEGIVNPNTGLIPADEDQDWLNELDAQINEIEAFLED